MTTRKKDTKSVSIRIGTMTHYKLNQLAKDLDMPIKELVEQAINEKFFGHGPSQQLPNSVPIKDLLGLVERYTKQASPAPTLPDWLE